MPIKATRALLSAALDGSLNDALVPHRPNFGFAVPVAVAGVDTILDPRSTWADGAAYDRQAKKLVVDMFIDNFEKFEDACRRPVLGAAPRLKEAAE
jgi:phosphoenolpyruvate carboxykinase (ATP)